MAMLNNQRANPLVQAVERVLNTQVKTIGLFQQVTV